MYANLTRLELEDAAHYYIVLVEDTARQLEENVMVGDDLKGKALLRQMAVYESRLFEVDQLCQILDREGQSSVNQFLLKLR